MESVQAAVERVLCCPRCQGNLEFSEAEILCASCRRLSPCVDGVIDLAASGLRTQLDDIDYDTVYGVDVPSSRTFSASMKTHLGSRLPTEIDTLVEIGAGTGLFTVGLLESTSIRTAVITDVSAKMLATCRGRIRSLVECRTQTACFVTFDGEKSCFKDASVDLVVGTSVLHHLADVDRTLRIICAALRPGGRAIFLEPGYKCHFGMVHVLSEVLRGVLRDPEAAWTESEVASLGGWLAEVHFNIKYRGDVETLRGREDKHLFDRPAIARAAAAAGFGGAEVIPFGGDDAVPSGAGVYLNQLTLSPATIRDAERRLSTYLPGVFAVLDDEDITPSMLMVLHKSPMVPPSSSPPRKIEIEGLASPRFLYDVRVARQVVQGAAQWRLEGWICGERDVRFVALLTGHGSGRVAVGASRLDVQSAVNRHDRFPLLRCMFSGLWASGALGDAEPVLGTTATVVAILDAGQHVELARLHFERDANKDWTLSAP